MVVELQDTKQWYAIIKEANRCFGLGNWYGQPKIKRRLDRNVWTKTMVGTRVWFDVPEREFASWIGVKFGIKVISVS
jgi:hypothetical protein